MAYSHSIQLPCECISSKWSLSVIKQPCTVSVCL